VSASLAASRRGRRCKDRRSSGEIVRCRARGFGKKHLSKAPTWRMGSLGLPTTLAPSDIVELIPAILHSIGGKISTRAVEQGLTVFPEFKKWLDSQSFDTRVFLKNQFSGDESALLTFDADYDTLSLGASARVSDEVAARYQTKVDLFKARLVSPCFAVGKPFFCERGCNSEEVGRGDFRGRRSEHA